MNREILIVTGVLVGAAVLFASNRMRSDLIAVFVLLSLMMSGVLTVAESLAGFSDPVVMIIVAMFVVSEALINTGIAQKMGSALMRVGRGNETRLIIFLMMIVGAVGAFMSSTAAVAIFIPTVLSITRKTGIHKKRLFMPLAVGALISGMMTLIATPPNLIVDKTLRAQGLEPLDFFDLTPFGICILIIGIAFMLLLGRRILTKEVSAEGIPQRRNIMKLADSYGLLDQFCQLRVSSRSPLIDRAVARMGLRDNYSINVLGFAKHRAGRQIFQTALPDSVFEVGDLIFVLGNEQQVIRFIEDQKLERVPFMLEGHRQKLAQKFGLAEVMLAPESKLVGKTIIDVQFRSRYNLSVLAVRRRGESLTEELTELKLDFGDTLLTHGDWSDILRLRNERENFVLLNLPEEYHELVPAQRRAPLALLILGMMVAAMALQILTNVEAALLAAVALIVSGCTKMESAYRAISWQTIVLIAGILPLSTALDKSGVAHLISDGLINTLGQVGPFGMLATIFMITAITGLFISNTATAVLIAPIAVEAALAIGVSAHAFAMTVAIACSAAYVTPISSPTNMLILEPGGYTFMDFVKVGLPLLFLTLVVTVILVKVLYIV